MCPPFTALTAVSEILAASPVGLGAQNCHWDAAGAHTGEISPPMLLELGAAARSCSVTRSAGTSWANPTS